MLCSCHRSRSKGPNSRQCLPKQPHISLKTKPRVFKSGRSVLLKEIMTHPRKTIPDGQREQDVGEIECEENGADELQKGLNTADDVQPATGAVGVLRQVKRVELVQCFVILLHLTN